MPTTPSLVGLYKPFVRNRDKVARLVAGLPKKGFTVGYKLVAPPSGLAGFSNHFSGENNGGGPRATKIRRVLFRSVARLVAGLPKKVFTVGYKLVAPPSGLAGFSNDCSG